METVGVRHLKEQTSAILRRVREHGEIFEVTYHGRVVARLVPVAAIGPEPAEAAFWADWAELEAQISALWPPSTSAVEAVREGRRDL